MDTRERVAEVIAKTDGAYWWERLSKEDTEYYCLCADQILSLSGTTDIECPECEDGRLLNKHQIYVDCPKCNGTGKQTVKTVGEILDEYLSTH